MQLRNLSDSIRMELQLPPEADAQLLELRGVGYHIGEKEILQDISLSMAGGQVLAIVGPNGAGKTTLLRLLSGDLHPSQGQVLIQGVGVAHYPPRQLALKRAVMSQQALVSAAFTVLEVAMMGRYPHQDSTQEEDERIVLDALRRTEIDHLRQRLYPTLSGGEQARVTLARVLAQRTPILLLDEPTAALDLRHQQIVMKIARQLATEGAAVILIVHDLNLAATHADQVAMLHNGRLFLQGAPQEVFTESHLQTIFNLPVRVLPHPNPPDGRAGCPLIVPLEPGG